MSNNSEEQELHKSVINWYPGHMAKTKRLIKENIDKIDIVYEVVDARIPYSSKVKDLDTIIAGKPKIIILTKYDLCDKKQTDCFIQEYKKQKNFVYPVDLEHNPNLKPLLQLTKEALQDFFQKREEKGLLQRKIRVLVVGVPNAGKSTLINRLVGKKTVSVGNRPGITKTLDWIRINEEIELLDTPGILWPKLDNQKQALNLASLTAIKEEILPIDEVVFHILKTLEQYYPNILQSRYGVENITSENYEETLTEIGKKRGCLIKGGQVDFDKVYTLIMNDIKMGNLKNITFDRVEEIYG